MSVLTLGDSPEADHTGVSRELLSACQAEFHHRRDVQHHRIIHAASTHQHRHPKTGWRGFVRRRNTRVFTANILSGVTGNIGSSPAGGIAPRRAQPDGHALGLYCDLLSMPGVLKLEHRQYAEEMRLVGSRSGALIERLIEQLTAKPERDRRGSPSKNIAGIALPLGIPNFNPLAEPANICKPVNLRRIVERCSGLLSRVAGGRAIEIRYGEAAAVPVPVPEEAVERILVNLIRNSAAALDARKSIRDLDTKADSRETLRVGVGLLVNRVGDPKPSPFRRVRLTVEDSGCGMDQAQLDRLATGTKNGSRSTHGIGFRVIQELVADSDGDLKVMSWQGVGTLVQIEWPVAAVSLTELAEAPSIAQTSALTKLDMSHAGINLSVDTRLASTRSLGPGSNTGGWVSC